MQEHSSAGGQWHDRVRVTRIDPSDAIAVAGGLYQPIRRQLDLRSFGVNAYFAQAGEQLIETHDETGAGSGGHTELYVVFSGHAIFTVDGEEVDAPSGTLVSVPDPRSKRSAKATTDGTSALVVGAPVENTMPVSPFEFWFIAEEPYKAGDYDTAIAIVSAGLDEHPDHPTMLYQLACYHALAGHREQALDCFERSCAGSPKAKEWQAGDTDLDAIRDDPRFQAALAAIAD
jgi:tetratricopeptide (TPR) repeat protein